MIKGGCLRPVEPSSPWMSLPQIEAALIRTNVWVGEVMTGFGTF
jgi:hypothetical protein